MIKRELKRKLIESAKNYPVVSIVGPRQSGKTTLVRDTFKKLLYVSLEKPSDLRFALEDPEGFLSFYSNGVVIDEIQRAPELFSYIQTIVDDHKKNGLYILTGSQNFNLMEKVTQSLAGRTAIHTLLPLSQSELKKSKNLLSDLNHVLFKGGYPRLYDSKLSPQDWLANYITTYLERDVRTLKNVGDLSTFQRFLIMCASRTGQILNLSSLANDCGIKHNTAKAWLSVLEASYIAFTLQPHFENFNKRMIKSPKLYFYDTGVVCNLLGLRNERELTTYQNVGGIFETYVISELRKNYFNMGQRPSLYYWQDKSRREVDCLVDAGTQLFPVEIKFGKTINSDFFKNLHYWCALAGKDMRDSYLVYGGNVSQKRTKGQVVAWDSLSKVTLL